MADVLLLRWTVRAATQSNTLTGLLVTRSVGGHIAESWMQWNQANSRERIGLDYAHIARVVSGSNGE